MFPPLLRFDLREHQDFFSNAQKIDTADVKIFWRKRLGGSKIAIIVPKTVSSLATVRNRVKRRFRSVLEPIILQTNSIETVVLVKRSAIKKTPHEFKEQLTKAYEGFSN